MEPTDKDIKNSLRKAPLAAIERLAAAVRALRPIPPDDLMRWVAPERMSDGGVHVGYPEYAPEVRELHEALYEAGVVIPFDWGNWDGVARLRRPEDVADASVADAARFVTTVVRSEHFGDGAMQPYLKNGTLVAAAGRVADWQLSATWAHVAPGAPATGRVEPALPGTPVTEGELRRRGFDPHELVFGDPVTWDGGAGVAWSTEGTVPKSSGLYAFTVSDGDALHVVYVGLASDLWAIAKGYDPWVKKARPGQRYGRPKYAGKTRKRINAKVAEQHHLGRHVQHWFREMPATETAAEESRLIAHWQLRRTGWNIKS